MEQLSEPRTTRFRLSDDGKRVYFDRAGNLWELTLADGRERQITRLTGMAGSLGDRPVSVRTPHLYFTWSSDLGDTWVMDVVPERE